MSSLPTIEQVNLQNYLEIVRTLDPELYLIKMALAETDVNPMIIPKIIRNISNLAIGTGYGKVQIFMFGTVITQVVAEESTKVNEPAVVDNASK